MKNEKFFAGVIVLSFFLLFSKPIFAESSYVLPYPSAMPGSVFYKLNLVKEEILKYWYFGDFGQFHFNLKQSDKYLVEAKTLFDYKQYLLVHKALKKSDKYFEKIYPNLLSAKSNGKNISEKEKTLKNAAQKHIEELVRIKNSVPSTFHWVPEREKPTKLNLWESLDVSIRFREDFKTLRHSGKRSQIPSGTWRSASRISNVWRDAGQDGYQTVTRQASMTFGSR